MQLVMQVGLEELQAVEQSIYQVEKELLVLTQIIHPSEEQELIR